MLVMAASSATISGRRVTVNRNAVRSLMTLERTPWEPRTVTAKAQVAEFPAASVAVLVTEVVPIGNNPPDDGIESTRTTSEQLSAAWITKETLAPDSVINSTDIFAGQVTMGGLVS